MVAVCLEGKKITESHWRGIYPIWAQFSKLFLHRGKKAQWESEEELHCCQCLSGYWRASVGKLQTHHCHIWRRRKLPCWLTRFVGRRRWRGRRPCLSVFARMPFNTTFCFHDMGNYFTERGMTLTLTAKLCELPPWQICPGRLHAQSAPLTINKCHVRAWSAGFRRCHYKTPPIYERRRAASTQPQPIKRQQTLRLAHNKQWLVAACAAHRELNWWMGSRQVCFFTLNCINWKLKRSTF